MRIEAVREPELDEATNAAVLRLQQRAFPACEQYRWTRHYTHVARPGDPRVLAWEGTALIGQVVLMWAMGRSDQGPLRLACIGNVCSDPDHRRTGAASRCMEHALELAAHEGADGALLFCRPLLETWYARLGFAAVRNEVFLARPDGTVYRRDWHDIRMGRMLTDRPWPAGDLYLDIEDF